MRFPNAYKGVKQIYTAEILSLVVGVLALIAAIIAIVAGASSDAGASEDAVGATILSAGLIGLVTIILAFVAFIINILGISNASKDEEKFKQALIWLIVGIAGSTISGFGDQGGVLNLLGELANTVSEIFVTFFVIGGITNLADKLGNTEMVKKGQSIVKMIVGLYIAVLVLDIIDKVLGESDFAIISGGVIGIIALIVAVVIIVAYLSFLSKARKMLAE